MAVKVTKNSPIRLSKSMDYARIGLGWDENPRHSGYAYDLDVEVFCTGDSGLCKYDNDLVFYNNLHGRNDGVIHTGDNRTGSGDGDDEAVLINFKNVPEDITSIFVTITIFEAEKRKQCFADVNNSYVRVVKLNSMDDENGDEEIKYELQREFGAETGVIAARIYRDNGGWSFEGLYDAFNGGLEYLCSKFGLETE